MDKKLKNRTRFLSQLNIGLVHNGSKFIRGRNYRVLTYRVSNKGRQLKSLLKGFENDESALGQFEIWC